ncbi:hypothetical protein [Sinomicrobium sp. M5D2P9]
MVICNRRKVAYDALQNQHYSHTRQEKRKLRDSSYIREVQQHEAKGVERTGTRGASRWLIAIAIMVFIVPSRVLRKHFRF